MRVRVHVRACGGTVGVNQLKGLRVGGLLFGGYARFPKLDGGSLDVSFGFVPRTGLACCGNGNFRCGNARGRDEVSSSSLPSFVYSFFLAGFWRRAFRGTFFCFFVFLFFFILPKNKNMSLLKSTLNIILVLVWRIAVFI